MLILGVLWWSWVGYAWLTSIEVDPEEGVVRITMFVAMAALLVAAACACRRRSAKGRLGLLFACVYAVVRLAQDLALFTIASRDDPGLRTWSGPWPSAPRSGTDLVGASFADDLAPGRVVGARARARHGASAFFSSEGWKLMPNSPSATG